MRIHIARYPVFMKLGYFLGERIRGQEVLVTLSVDLVPVPEGIRDDLEKTADYGAILKCVDQTLGDREMKLIESAVENVGEVLLREFAKIRSVDVCIEKPIIPNGLAKGAQVSVSGSFHREESSCPKN